MESNYKPGQEPPTRQQPKRVEIAVTVTKDRDGNLRLNLDPATVDLTIKEQAAWRCNDGRLEIRFAPNNAPFLTASFSTARGGTTLSGAPTEKKISRTPYPYTLLVTTPDGFFIKQDADLRAVAVDGSTGPRPDPPRPDPPGGNQGKGCLTLLGFGLIASLVMKIRTLF